MSSCPYCHSDLAKAIAAVPPEVTKHAFPLRCTACKYLLKLWPFEAGPVATPLPMAEVVNFLIEERRPKAGDAAG